MEYRKLRQYVCYEGLTEFTFYSFYKKGSKGNKLDAEYAARRKFSSDVYRSFNYDCIYLKEDK